MSGQTSSPNKSSVLTSSVLMGRIGAAHGLKGQVRINSYTQDPLAIGRYGELFTPTPGLVLKITSSRLAKTQKSTNSQSIIIAAIEGIDTRKKAEKLKGTKLYVPRERLDENNRDDDEFLHIDLIGLEARLKNGTIFGKVIAMPNYGASDLVEIKQPSGKTVLLPFTRTNVPDIFIKEGYLNIVLPEETDGEER